MDLGCLNLGCIEKQSKEISLKEDDSNAAKIKRSPNCKSSPINWFPRKKVDSFLKRKIQHLQEADGMNLTLDETLGDANPHYSRVLKEKMAVREAAHKAMEARKAAMVEASWFRILKAARIESKVAEEQLLKAEECAAKAFEAATAIGVIMNDAPDCPTKRYKIETSSPKGGSTTHTIKASFETAFDVDKQVAVAVKSAFMKLEDCPSIDKDDLKKLLRKISEHPDLHEHYQEQSECSSDCESDVGADTRVETRKKAAWDTNYEKKKTPVSQKKQKKRHAIKKFTKENLVDIMLERLRGLPEDGLSSLATIVATCGLSAALAEAEIGSKQDLGPVSGNSSTHLPLRSSSFRRATMNGHMRKETLDSELPSLDKFLVKRLTRLEREVLEAKNARKNEQKPVDIPCSSHITSGMGNDLQKDPSKSEENFDTDLGSILVKHASKLEKEVEEARTKDARLHGLNGNNPDKKKSGVQAKETIEVPSLDTCLLKRMSRLEKEVQEAKNQRHSNRVDHVPEKENMDMNTDPRSDHAQRRQSNHPENHSTFSESLDKVLVKHVPGLEKLKLQSEEEIVPEMKRREDSRDELKTGGGEAGLDQVMVKHKSRLEIEKAQQQADTQILHSSTRRVAREKELEEAWGGDAGLDQVLVKHKSRLEIDKAQQPDTQIRHSSTRRVARVKELEEAWGGEASLDQVLVKHKSKLEIEKAQQQTDTQIRHSSARRVAREKELEKAWGGLSLGNSMHPPRPSKLDKDKQPTEVRRSSARRDAREKELQEAWGGLSLGNSMRPHQSKLERDQAAWLKAAEDERRGDVIDV